jgi:hypothetical protein
VRNPKALRRQLRWIRTTPKSSRPKLLAFFLFDDRQSQQVVAEYTVREFQWLDGLARSAHMVLFFFGKQSAENKNDDPQVLLLEGREKAENPSLDVASRFGITADQLPGIVFFQDLDLDSVAPHHGVYWPIDVHLFREDPEEVEQQLSMLFSLAERVRWSENPEHTLQAFQKEIESLRNSHKRRSLFAGAAVVLAIVSYTGTMIDVVNSAFTRAG